MDNLRKVRKQANGLAQFLESLSKSCSDLLDSVLKDIRTSSSAVKDLIESIDNAEEVDSPGTKIWVLNNYTKVEFISAMLDVAKEVYDSLPDDEAFNFVIEINQQERTE